MAVNLLTLEILNPFNMWLLRRGEVPVDISHYLVLTAILETTISLNNIIRNSEKWIPAVYNMQRNDSPLRKKVHY